MSREIKRVPLNFDAPLRETWPGYLMPEELHAGSCPACGGRGYSARARRLFDLWYGHVPFEPSDNGSQQLTEETPAVREFAERNVTRSPDFYGTDEAAIVREARRLAGLWNGQWSHHLNADDVAALVEAGRLHDLTHTWTKDGGWQPKDPPVIPTPEQVNEWAIRAPFGHDAINASVVVRARCQREGAAEVCATCAGSGSRWRDEKHRTDHEAWKPTEPPTGEGWQLWETVSEGSPISPVFATAEELARWMSQNRCTVNGPVPYETALRFIGEGWAPSLVGGPGGVVDGVTWIGGAA